MTNLAPLLAAMIAVESSGNPNAIGDGGRARGVLQIHPAVVADCNRIAGTRFTHRDAHRPDVARWMAATYLHHWVTPARLGRQPTAEDYARAWNGGGPAGWRKPQTLRYWQRVRKAMR